MLDPDYPLTPSSEGLLNAFQKIGARVDILPHDARPDIAAGLKARQLDMDDWERAFCSSNKKLYLPRETPVL